MKDITHIIHIIQQHQSGYVYLFHQGLTMVSQVHSVQYQMGG